MPDRPLLCSIVEAGRLLGIGRSATYLLLSSNQLKSVKLGKRRLVKRDSIDAFAASLPTIQLKQAPVKVL
jgi:excisionase family DNA binding protein